MTAMRNISFLLLSLGFLSSCVTEVTNPEETAVDKDRKRGCLIVTEVNWAGSMTNGGVYDPDDDFIEVNNRDCNKPVDLTGWEFVMDGDVVRTFVVPEAPSGKSNIIQPAELRVLIAKENGAFRANSSNGYDPIVMSDLKLPEESWTIETFTAEHFLIENAFNNREGKPLAGGTDGFTVRSMERTDDNFDEEGTSVTSWHSYTPCNEASPDGTALLMGTQCGTTGTVDLDIGETGINVNSNYANRTFASPGTANTPQYK